MIADLLYLQHFRPTPFSLRLVGALILKDVIVQGCWFNGFFARTVMWRGNRLRVGMHSRLLPLEGERAGDRWQPSAGRRLRAGTGGSGG